MATGLGDEWDEAAWTEPPLKEKTLEELQYGDAREFTEWMRKNRQLRVLLDACYAEFMPKETGRSYDMLVQMRDLEDEILKDRYKASAYAWQVTRTLKTAQLDGDAPARIVELMQIPLSARIESMHKVLVEEVAERERIARIKEWRTKNTGEALPSGPTIPTATSPSLVLPTSSTTTTAPL